MLQHMLQKSVFAVHAFIPFIKGVVYFIRDVFVAYTPTHDDHTHDLYICISWVHDVHMPLDKEVTDIALYDIVSLAPALHAIPV